MKFSVTRTKRQIIELTTNNLQIFLLYIYWLAGIKDSLRKKELRPLTAVGSIQAALAGGIRSGAHKHTRGTCFAL